MVCKAYFSRSVARDDPLKGFLLSSKILNAVILKSKDVSVSSTARYQCFGLPEIGVNYQGKHEQTGTCCNVEC